MIKIPKLPDVMNMFGRSNGPPDFAKEYQARMKKVIADCDKILEKK